MEGRKHAQAQVWCTWVTQIRYGWAGSQLSSQMLLILVATLLHIQDQCFRYALFGLLKLAENIVLAELL